MNTFIYGFSLGLSLILAIGSQNAFVLKQGLKGEHLLLVCLICAASDAILILIGVSGFHLLVSKYPEVALVARYGGAIFLFLYGLRSFYNARCSSTVLNPSDIASNSWMKSALICLAFTWLNPHVYLDTVVLLGSISAQFSGQLLYFTTGAITASFVFFFALGYGAQLLRPLFARARSWQVLEILIGCIMWAIAAKLLFMQ
jgi:L-lysine exporter family protein LysE/ArgO